MYVGFSELKRMLADGIARITSRSDYRKGDEPFAMVTVATGGISYTRHVPTAWLQ